MPPGNSTSKSNKLLVDNELAFGEAAPPHAMLEHDRKFMERRAHGFARGEVLLSFGKEGLLAYKCVREHRFDEAIALYEKVLREHPDKPHFWVNRGVALQAKGRLDDALASFNKSLDLDPNYVAGFINRGVVLGWMCRCDEALEAYTRALEIEPNNEPGLLGRAVIYSQMGRHQEALADSEYAIKRNPGSGGAHFNRALTLLSLGDYLEGFREHEWRFGTKMVLGKYRFIQPRWTGQPTKKPILITCEQGLGDAIQFLRYIPLMKAQGLDVRLQCPPTLMRLCKQLDIKCFDEVQFKGFDWHCPIISLAAIYKTTIDNIPATDKYLTADPNLIFFWANRLFDHFRYQVGIRPRVGLAWWSGVRLGQVIAETMQRRKSIETRDILPLLNMGGIEFVSLQKDMPAGGIPDGLYDPMQSVLDLADTAAIIANLDLVITVDSAVAHLAGAMGKRVWVLNRHDICWRWLSGAKEAPWYQSARVYRQSRPFYWADVIDQVKNDLRETFA